jgi:hypothetical protein
MNGMVVSTSYRLANPNSKKCDWSISGLAKLWETTPMVIRHLITQGHFRAGQPTPANLNYARNAGCDVADIVDVHSLRQFFYRKDWLDIVRAAKGGA